MFVRVKKVGTYRYLQIAENRREGKRVKQTIIVTLGRLDKLAASGAIDQLLRSAARFAERVMVLSEHSRDAHDRPDANVVSIGPALIFERLWRETGCQEVVRKLLATRHHHFDVERAVFMTVLHRLMVSGSDRSALQWRRDQAIDGTEALKLQHLYRAMGWLGEALGEREPDAPSARRVKDLIEEELFARRRDLFSALDLVFFDTTSLFFTGNGGDTLGQYGKSKDHRSDCKQMVLGMVIDGDGIPVCSEMWPGNTTDVTTLDQVAGRLQGRFGVRRVCLVADAGMISKKMIAAVEARGWFYILGARLRRTKEVRDVVLSDTGAFETVEVARQRPDPVELHVKEVTVCDAPFKGTVNEPRRYVVCRNPDQARKDAATRAQILAALEHKLSSDGPKGVVANKGYKRYLGVDPNSWTPDPLGRRYPPCRDQDRRTRRSSGARWLSWCEPDGVRKSCHESSSRRRRRSATGSCKASVTRGVAGMGQAPRSERSCVAFAERIVGCAKNEISWQKPRPGLLGGPYRGGLPVHESESGRVSNRHDGPSARSLPERVLRVAHP